MHNKSKIFNVVINSLNHLLPLLVLLVLLAQQHRPIFTRSVVTATASSLQLAACALSSAAPAHGSFTRVFAGRLAN